jgi:hypothetical protein
MNKTITLLILGVIFLALLLMVLNAFKLEDRQVLPALLPEKTRPHGDSPLAPAEGSVPMLAPSAPTARSSDVLASPVPQAAPQPEERIAFEPAPVAVKTVPAQIDAGHAAPPVSTPQAAAPSRPAPPQVPAMPESNARQRGVKNITNIVVYATQEGATLRLGGDAPLACTPMLLRNPDRLALDCPGQWNAHAPGVPQNKFIKAVRVGRQAGATRLVLDLHQAPASYRVVQTSPQGLDLRLR